KVRMENKEIVDYVSIRKVDQKVYPFNMVTQENEILPGFIWRPQDRPKSVEDMLNRSRTPVATDDTDDKNDQGHLPPNGEIEQVPRPSLEEERIESEMQGSEAE